MNVLESEAEVPESRETQTLEHATNAVLRKLVPANAGLVLAVSGGLDSMVLLDVVSRISRAESRPLIVAHLNHGLRGPASDHDAELVSEAASRRHLICVKEKVPDDALRNVSGMTVEEAARATRYEFLERVAKQHQMAAVATAHHSTDQAETVLHNIIRGTGLSGLRGMRPSRVLSEAIPLVRPFLQFSRRTLEEWAHEHQLPYAMDETNSDTNYTRNRLRMDIMPCIRTHLNPQLDSALTRLAEQAGETLDCMDYFAEQILREAILERSPAACRIRTEPLLTLPVALLRHLFVKVWEQLSWPRQSMTARHWQRLSDAVRMPSASFSLPGGIQAEISRALVRLTRTIQKDN